MREFGTQEKLAKFVRKILFIRRLRPSADNYLGSTVPDIRILAFKIKI